MQYKYTDGSRPVFLRGSGSPEDVFLVQSLNMFAGSSQDTQAKQNSGYSLHQLQGNKAHGTERSGILYKRSEGWVLF